MLVDMMPSTSQELRQVLNVTLLFPPLALLHFIHVEEVGIPQRRMTIMGVQKVMMMVLSMKVTSQMVQMLEAIILMCVEGYGCSYMMLQGGILKHLGFKETHLASKPMGLGYMMKTVVI